MPEGYIPIRVDTISDNEIIPFDVYTFEDDRYFLFCASKNEIKKSLLSKTYLQERRFLYIKQSDEKQYRNYLEDHLPRLLRDDDNPVDARIDILRDVSHIIARQLFTDRLNFRKERLDRFITQTIGFIFTRKINLAQLIRISEKSFHLYNHMLHCAFYASMFFPYTGVSNSDLVKRLAMGAFLHDIGKARIPQALLSKGGILTPAERQEYNLHPSYGIQMLQHDLGISDPIIESMILNHHERINGSGYPKGKRQLSVYDRALAVIDIYDNLTYKRSETGERSSVEALTYMIEDEKAGLDQSLIRMFAQMISQR